MEEKSFIKMYSLLFSIHLKKDVSGHIKTLLKSKDIYLLGFLLKYSAEVDLGDLQEKIINTFSDLLYDKDQMIIIFVLKHMRIICSQIKDEELIKKFLNNIKNLIQNK